MGRNRFYSLSPSIVVAAAFPAATHLAARSLDCAFLLFFLVERVHSSLLCITFHLMAAQQAVPATTRR
jgi:hypothetical protein